MHQNSEELFLAIFIFIVICPMDISRCTIEILEEFSCSTHFRDFVTTAKLCPSLFDKLNPNFTLSSFAFREGKYNFPMFRLLKWKPIIDNNRSWLTIQDKLDRITSSFVNFLGQKVVSYSLALFIIRYIFFILMGLCDT